MTVPGIAMALVGLMGGAQSASADNFAFSPGIIIDVSFGDTWNVGLGLDLRGTVLFGPDHCSSDTAANGVGLYVGAQWLIHGNTARITAGVHGGWQVHEGTPSWDFEAGWLWQGAVADTPGGHGLQVGLLTTQGVFDGAARFSVFNGDDRWYPQAHLGLGGRFVSPFGIGPLHGCPSDIRTL